MTAITDMLSTTFFDCLGWTLLHSLWQCTAIGLVAGASLTALRRYSSNIRYCVACVGLLTMLASCLLTFAWLASSTASNNVLSGLAIDEGQFAPQRVAPDSAVPTVNPIDRPSAATTAESEPQQLTQLATEALSLGAYASRVAPWLSWFAAAWMGGVILLSIRNVGGWIGVQRLQRIGTTPASRECFAVAHTLMARMKVSRPVQIAESTAVQIPIVVGCLRPMILLPVCLLAEMSPAQLEAILAHELAHVRRHDYLVNIVQMAIETLLFYHPAAWWISKQIRTEREHCCDDAAAQACGSSIGLSEALTIVAAIRVRLQPAMAATGHRSGSVVARVQRLLGPQPEPTRRPQAFGAAIVLLFLTVFLAAAWSSFATDVKPGRPVPLADAVRDFNRQTQADSVGKSQPPLTVDEVVAAIRSKPPQELGGDDDLVAIFQKIADRQQLPHDAELDFMTQWGGFNDVTFDVWWIHLTVTSSAGKTYRIPLRQRVLKSHVKPVLERRVVRSEEAQKLVERYKPHWGTANQGLQIGISRLDDEQSLQMGDRLPLEFFLRNHSDKTISIEFIREFDRTLTVDGAGEIQPAVVTSSIYLHLMVPELFTLKPGEVIAFKHPGLGIGEQSFPYLASPQVGRYSLKERLRVKLVSDSDSPATTQPLELLTAPVSFKITERKADARNKIKANSQTGNKPTTELASASFAPKGPDETAGGKSSKVTLSGRIIREDGSAATVKGYLYADTSTGTGNDRVQSFLTAGRFTDRFSFDVPVGTVCLKYFADGFAPAWIGPLTTESGKSLSELTIVLRPGFSCPVHVVSTDGQPVSKATLVASPIIGGDPSGPNFKHTTNEKGEFLLEHLAEVPYLFHVEAPGHEPLNADLQVLKPDQLITLKMTRSKPTTGIVVAADGKPLAAAKIRFLFEEILAPDVNQWAQDVNQPVMATTDAAGRFVLDQLSSASSYLFVAEAPDKSRVLLRDVRAGQRDLRVDMPKRRDLHVRLVGNLRKLPVRQGQPFIQAQQEISVGEKNAHIELLGDDVTVTPTDEGGLAEYHGLVDGTVRVTAGNAQETFDVDDEGTTTVVLHVPKVAP